MGKFNIKSLFIEEIPDNVENENVTKSSNNKQNVEKDIQKSNVDTFTSKTNETPSVNTETEEVNTELLNRLCNYLETCKIEGGDYMQLKKAANSDGMKVIPDEAVRFQAAYATLKSVNSNLTKDIIINSIDTYISEMNNQYDIAIKQIEEKRKVNVGDKKKLHDEKAQRIAKLQKEIVELSTEMTKLSDEIKESDAECDKNAKDFKNAVNIIVSALESDKKKILEKLVS